MRFPSGSCATHQTNSNDVKILLLSHQDSGYRVCAQYAHKYQLSDWLCKITIFKFQSLKYPNISEITQVQTNRWIIGQAKFCKQLFICNNSA